MRAADVPAEDLEMFISILTEDMDKMARIAAGWSTSADAFDAFVREHREGLDALEKRSAELRDGVATLRRSYAERVAVLHKLKARRGERRAA